MVTYYILAGILQMTQWPYLLSISLRGLVQHSVRKSLSMRMQVLGMGLHKSIHALLQRRNWAPLPHPRWDVALPSSSPIYKAQVWEIIG